MNTISMPQLCDEHAAMTPVLLPSAKSFAAVIGGFGATSVSVAGSGISGSVARERFIDMVAPVLGEVSDRLVKRDVPIYVNSNFAGVRRSVPLRPPV